MLLGLSGGADSVYLTLVLQELAREWELELSLIHVNHGIRGEEADRDEQFCLAFAGERGLPVSVFRGEVPRLAEQRNRSLEETAREYRYECMAEQRRLDRIDKVAVAHHQDDQAETILFQLLRGSGLRGMGGMKPAAGHIVRPLLELRHTEIREELEACGQSWCEDSTNGEDSYLRNRIRHQVIPLLEEQVNPAAVEHLSQTAVQLQMMQDFLEQELEKWREELVSVEETGSRRFCVPVDRFLYLPMALQRELARWMLVEGAGKSRDITCRHIEALASLAEGESGKRLDLPYGMLAGKDYNTLWLEKGTSAGAFPKGDGREANPCRKAAPCWERDRKEPLEIVLRITNGRGMRVCFHRELFLELYEHNDRKIPKNNCTKWFDYAKIGGMLEFRHPASGDFLWLAAGEKLRKPLNRLLIDLHIPREQRKSLWVLADGSHIVWIPELGRGSAGYYVSEQTEEILCAELCMEDVIDQ